MSEENQQVSDLTTQEPVANEAEPTNQSQKDSVKYETYSKVLGEKKKVASENELLRKKLAEVDQRDQEAKEKQLQEEQRWQEYAKEQEKKAEEASDRLTQYEQREIYQSKVAKVVSCVEGLSSKYHHLINAEAIKLDESGEFDESTLQAEVERIKKDYPEILSKPSNASFPGNAPKPNGSAQLSPTEYARLTRDDKKKRLGEISTAPDWMKGKF